MAVFTRFTLLLLLLLTLLAGPLAPIPASAASAAPSDKADNQNEPVITLSVRSTPEAEHRTTLTLRSKSWRALLSKAQPTDEAPIIDPVPYSFTELAVPDSSGNLTRYRWEGEAQLLLPVDERGTTLTDRPALSVPDKLARRLDRLTDTLEQAHYGKPADWPTAGRLLPRMAVFRILDLDTGLSFRGQRRAGSAHADVQPVTAADSAIMKTIYGGKWSWNRRAVLLESPEGWVAGSMHGMPHGGDGIPGNQFDGHFCIHFQGTVTHGSGHSDPGHQVMAHKAAGQLKAYYASLSPEDLVDLFLTASNQKDAHLMGLLLAPRTEERGRILQAWMDEQLTVRRTETTSTGASHTPDEAEPALQTEVRSRVDVWMKGSPSRAVTYVWTFSRASASSPWRVTAVRPA